MDEDIYVVVAELDTTETYKRNVNPRPIVFEMYADNATKEHAQKFIDRLNGSYGKCRIAKLQFEDSGTDHINDKNDTCIQLLKCCPNAFNNIPDQKIHNGKGGSTYKIASEIENFLGLIKKENNS